MAISHMAALLRTTWAQEQAAVMKLLQLILLTKQGSNEAQTLLSAVLNIVASPLDHSLRSYQRQNPSSQEVEPLLKAIKENLRVSRRTGGADHKELEQWTSTPNGGLVASVRHTIVQSVQWSLNPGINITPPSYTHRQVLAASKLLGPKRLLCAILDEVKQQTDAGSAGIVYDIATALVCAPDVTNMPAPVLPAMLGDPNQQVVPMQVRTTLRQALQREVLEFKKMQKADNVMAETVMRLYRRVEAQMAMPEPAQMLQEHMGLGLDENAAASLGDALAAAGGDGLGTETNNVELDLDGAGNMNIDLSSTNDGGLGVGDDDIFGGLDMGNGADLLEGWDGMDLT